MSLLEKSLIHMKKIMINYTISSTTNKWTKRIRKIDEIIIQILAYKKDLKFINNINYYCDFILANDKFIKNINYYCDFILANDKFIKDLNKKFRKVNQPTDVLTFVSKLSLKNKKEDRHCDLVFSIDTILNDVKKK